MSRLLPPLAILLVVLGILSAGCSSTPAGTPAKTPQGNGTLHLSSVPAGAEIWIDGEYQGPGGVVRVPAGHHTVEFRMAGYENLTYPVNVVNGGMDGIRATLVSSQTILSAANSTGTDLPHVVVNGYWTYPPGYNSTADPGRWNYTTNPVPLVLHTEVFNVGTADAKEVTVSANLYNEGHLVCQAPLDLGALAVGGQVTRDVPATCTLPTGYAEGNLVVLVENVVVTP